MENQNNRMDELFRQRLHDAEVPPPPFVWPAVEHELRKRRRRWALWLFAFGTATACICLWQGARYWGFEVNPTAVNQEKTATPPEQTNLVQETQTNTAIPEPSSNTANEEKPDVAAAIVEKSSGQPAPSFGRSAKGPKAAPTFEKNTANIPAEKTSATGVEDNKGEQAKKQEETIAAPLAGNLDLQSWEMTLPKALYSDKQTQSGLWPKTYKAVSKRKKPAVKLCYDFAHHPSAWMLDVYAGPSLAQRSLNSRSDDKPYLNRRLATERRNLAMNAGLRASLMFDQNFLIRTGLNYDQMTEVFEYVDPAFVMVDIHSVYLNGQYIRTDTIVSYGENYLKTYNRYIMLDVPLMVGMEMRKGRSGISINLGISANLVFRKSGVIIDPATNEPARFGPIPNKPKGIGPDAQLGQDVFRANAGLSANASIQWYWHLSPKFRVFAEPSFRQVLRPVTLASHPVEQRYSMLGLRLGATKIF